VVLKPPQTKSSLLYCDMAIDISTKEEDRCCGRHQRPGQEIGDLIAT
jgi:hypothetical protein